MSKKFVALLKWAIIIGTLILICGPYQYQSNASSEPSIQNGITDLEGLSQYKYISIFWDNSLTGGYTDSYDGYFEYFDHVESYFGYAVFDASYKLIDGSEDYFQNGKSGYHEYYVCVDTNKSVVWKGNLLKNRIARDGGLKPSDYMIGIDDGKYHIWMGIDYDDYDFFSSYYSLRWSGTNQWCDPIDSFNEYFLKGLYVNYGNDGIHFDVDSTDAEGAIYYSYIEAPFYSGTRINETTVILLEDWPEIKEITAEGVGTLGNHPTTGKPVRLEADIYMPEEFELTDCSWVGYLWSGKGDVNNNCRLEYETDTGQGPAPDTYGDKTIELVITFRYGTGEQTAQIDKTHKYKVFFDKDGNDNMGEIDGDNKDKGPNWFEYWGDDGAVPGLDASDVKFRIINSNTLGKWDRIEDEVIIYQNAAKGAGDSYIKCPWQGQDYYFDYKEGIDLVSEVLAHERRHESIYHYWDDAPNNACEKAYGPWFGCSDTDTDIPHDRLYFPGSLGDGLPDEYEKTIGTDPNNADTCGLGGQFPSSAYSFFGDNELDCRQHAKSAIGIASLDWANPGKQTPNSPIISTNEANNLVVTNSGPLKEITKLTDVSDLTVTSYGFLTGNYSDIGLDADSDGLFDIWQFTVEVQINQPGNYEVVAWLQDEFGNDIGWGGNGIGLLTGTQNIEINFDGKLIYENNINGPYTISNIELIFDEFMILVDFADNVYTTEPILYTDFDPPDVQLTESYSENGVDTNSDGLYDTLNIGVGIQVEEPGEYTIIGELEAFNSIAVARKTESYTLGSNNVTLEFDGKSIYWNRENGPYYLKALRVENQSGTQVDFVYNAYTTTAYTYSQFQHSESEIDVSSFSDIGLDFDDNGLYEFLLIEFDIHSPDHGIFSVYANIEDSTGKYIDTFAQTIGVYTDTITTAFHIPASTIKSNRANGPYKIASIVLLDDSGEIIDVHRDIYTTDKYDFSEFEGSYIDIYLPIVTNQ